MTVIYRQYAMRYICIIIKKIYIKNKTDYEMKFKHWWDKIPSISTKRTIISHLNSLNAKQIPLSMPLEVKVMACEKHKHVADFHLIMISLIKDCCWQDVAEPRVSSAYIEVITLKVLRSSSMTRCTISEYLCHKWPQVCSVSRNHKPDL